MFLIPVKTFLEEMDHFAPHQELLEQGKLLAWKPEMAGKIIFVSHQWAGHDDPDPDREQYRCLARILRRMVAGEVRTVETNPIQTIIFKENPRILASELKSAVPESYLWVDYCCIWQPSHDKTKEPQLPTTNASRRSSDHRAVVLASSLAVQSESNALALAKLNDAVDSIPSYIEAASLVLVLVPICSHKNRDEVLTYQSWRSRGWCRLELCAAYCARNEVHVMVVKGAEAQPEFIFPADALFLAVGEGSFTCCHRNHDFGDGEGTAPCDKEKIVPVIRAMLAAKVAHLFGIGRIFEARYLVCVEHWLMRGLRGIQKERALPADESKAVEESKTAAPGHVQEELTVSPRVRAASADLDGSTEDSLRLATATSTDDLRERLRWGSDEQEVAFTNATGTTLLFWAVLSNSINVVRDLLSGGEGDERPQKVADLVRPIKHAWPNALFVAKMLPIHLAMAYGGWEIVDALLDAGADPFARDKAGADGLFWAALNGRPNNIRRWLARFPDWNLERTDAVAKQTAFTIAVNLGGGNSLPAAKALLEAGANPQHRIQTGNSVLHFAAINPDCTPELVDYLLTQNAASTRALVDRNAAPRSCLWRTIFLATRLARRTGSSNSVVRLLAESHKATPLHLAAKEGNVAMVQGLVAAGASVRARTALGRTPFALAAATRRETGELPKVLEDSLRL